MYKICPPVQYCEQSACRRSMVMEFGIAPAASRAPPQNEKAAAHFLILITAYL